MILWFTLSPEKPYSRVPPILESSISFSFHCLGRPASSRTRGKEQLTERKHWKTVTNRDNSPFPQHLHQVTPASCIWADEFWTKHFHMEAPNFLHVQTGTLRCASPWGNKCAFIFKWTIQNHTLSTVQFSFLYTYIFWRHPVFILHSPEI